MHPDRVAPGAVAGQEKFIARLSSAVGALPPRTNWTKLGEQAVMLSSIGCTDMTLSASALASAENDTRTQPAFVPPWSKLINVPGTLTGAVDVVKTAFVEVNVLYSSGGQAGAADTAIGAANASPAAAPALAIILKIILRIEIICPLLV